MIAVYHTSWNDDTYLLLVATVETDDLEVAFERTNHQSMRDWTENEGVNATYLAQNPRSTQVGDVLVRDGQPYLVEELGFGSADHLHLRDPEHAPGLYLDEARALHEQQADYELRPFPEALEARPGPELER